MLLKYKTIYKSAVAEIVEKKSRFIAYTYYVETEEAALEFINNIKKKNHNASHNTFAYRLCGKVILERQSDDGEPSGTAGIPILDVLRGEEVLNTIVVVTRYFGGTLLGTGGLYRAYSKAAKEGLKGSEIIEKTLFQTVNIKVDYNLSGKVQYAILNANENLKEILYTELVEFIVYIEKGKEDDFIKKMEEMTSANAEIYKGVEIYGGMIDTGFIEL